MGWACYMAAALSIIHQVRSRLSSSSLLLGTCSFRNQANLDQIPSQHCGASSDGQRCGAFPLNVLHVAWPSGRTSWILQCSNLLVQVLQSIAKSQSRSDSMIHQWIEVRVSSQALVNIQSTKDRVHWLARTHPSSSNMLQFSQLQY